MGGQNYKKDLEAKLQKKIEIFYKRVMNRSKDLAGHLMAVCHIFNGVDTDFKAMQMFQQIEEEFSATLLAQI